MVPAEATANFRTCSPTGKWNPELQLESRRSSWVLCLTQEIKQPLERSRVAGRGPCIKKISTRKHSTWKYLCPQRLSILPEGKFFLSKVPAPLNTSEVCLWLPFTPSSKSAYSAFLSWIWVHYCVQVLQTDIQISVVLNPSFSNAICTLPLSVLQKPVPEFGQD